MGGMKLGMLDMMGQQQDPSGAGILDMLKPMRLSDPMIAEIMRIIQMQQRMQPSVAQRLPPNTYGVRG